MFLARPGGRNGRQRTESDQFVWAWSMDGPLCFSTTVCYLLKFRNTLVRCRERSPAQACEFLKAGALRSFKSSLLSAWMSVVTWLPRAFWAKNQLWTFYLRGFSRLWWTWTSWFWSFFFRCANIPPNFSDLKTASKTSKLQQQQLEVNVSIWDHGISPWRSTWDLLPLLQRLGSCGSTDSPLSQVGLRFCVEPCDVIL